jgi:dTDP-4-amino-4,6-dideoxygalactose transaminase
VPPHKQEAFRGFTNLNFPVSEQVSLEGLSLPIGPHLNPSDVDYVCETLIKGLAALREK